MSGTIINRGKDTWRLQVYNGTDFNGKPIRHTKTFHGSKRDAQKALALFTAEVEKGSVAKASTVTVAALCDLFIEDYAKRFLKVSAQRSAASNIKIWIKPYLGDRKANKVKRLDVQRFVNMIADERSPKTVRNIYATLRGIMAHAVDLGILADTPCTNIKMPKKTHTEAKYYSVDEVDSILNALAPLHGEELKYKIMVQIALFGGLRKSEILGLNWDDVDFDENVINIRRTRMIKPNEGIYEDTPKTNNSIRAVTLPEEIFNSLRKLKAYQAEQQLSKRYYNTSPAVFRNEIGNPLYPQVFQRWYTRFCRDNNIPYKGLHALRHTHASILAGMEGVDLASVSKRLGHAQISTTLNIYTHLFKNKEKNITDNLSKNFQIK